MSRKAIAHAERRGTSEFSIDKDSHQFTRSEGLNALFALMEGMAKRQNWATLQKGIDEADALSIPQIFEFRWAGVTR
ncbi:MAG: hypothetical protein K1X64_14320 [Myxococcaceae bacterium]|nr:hypothetical protein [Myxococcaceae bacterium]